MKPIHSLLILTLLALTTAAVAETTNNGSVLPFPPTPMSDSVAKPRLQDSKMQWPQEPSRLPADAPNILIVLIDDVGFGVADTFGGEVHTPTLSKLADEGVSYNSFHTTAICSPTRASLLTGRNHTRVGSGTIAERAVAFDGYTGIIPKSTATVAEVLKQYGYHTSAFGKWHNTPATETTAIGPKNRWPNGYGFEYFYGFLAGETSQWEPRLVENYDTVEPPHDERYHLTEDMVDKALTWLDQHQSFAPDKPFLMYWAPGAAHGPHHIWSEWADKYKGKFDEGWEAYRERVHQRQLEMGVIPPGTELTPRDETMAAWDDIPENQRAFQRRGMEIFAGFVEHTDVQVGRLVEGLDQRGLRENTLIFYIFGDNGSSAEGQEGSISELLAQNNIPNTVEQQLAALHKIGGLEALGSPKTDNMYHSGWAWAGSTPFKATKLVASHFGGTRNPMVVSWPKGIQPDKKMRSQFHHVVDIAPTIYEILGIDPPKIVNGHDQIKIDGASLAYTFSDADAGSTNAIQYFDNNGSRAIYKDGWVACTFGPLLPWNTAASAPRIAQWDSATDEWELYHVAEDFSQSRNLAAEYPDKLEELKKEFQSAKDYILADYRGLNVEQITNLRNKLRETGARFKVVKNRHVKIAMHDLDMPEITEQLVGPTAMALTTGEAGPAAKILVQIAGDTALTLKGGVIDGQVFDGDQIRKFSELPTKDELLAKLMSAMNGPAQALVYTIQAVPQKLARTLKAVADKKAAEA